MATLPSIPPDDLRRHLQALSPEPLSAAALDALLVHYAELRAWSRSLALIGPGTVAEVLERHFGEALAALPLVPPEPAGSGELVDVGSGAGFPGLVLAAARPRWRVTLIEARQRKWSFLMAVARKAALSVQCLDARVAVPLPAGLPGEIERVTMRAVRLPEPVAAALLGRLGAAGSALYWTGADHPVPPPGFAVASLLPLAGSERRRIVEVRRAVGAGVESL
ncbi:MAG TPA: RsmG family class I SAM-dependent methyltransferase [Thermoanaerobaculia bacterium]|nr:RsmG family class I SAM-dependent methyltransferase [Thermoanaerobaculia bacterium]